MEVWLERRGGGVAVAGKRAWDSAGSWRRSDKATRTKEGSAVQAKGGGRGSKSTCTSPHCDTCNLMGSGPPLQRSTVKEKVSHVCDSTATNKGNKHPDNRALSQPDLFLFLFFYFILCRITSLTGSISFSDKCRDKSQNILSGLIKMIL